MASSPSRVLLERRFSRASDSLGSAPLIDVKLAEVNDHCSCKQQKVSPLTFGWLPIYTKQQSVLFGNEENESTPLWTLQFYRSSWQCFLSLFGGPKAAQFSRWQHVCLFLCLILFLVQVLLIWPAANFPPFCRAESLRRSHELIVKSAASAWKSCQQKRTHSRSSSDNVVFSCVSATFICWPQYIESVKKHLHRVVECCSCWDNSSSTSSFVSIPSFDLRQKMYNQLSQLTVSLSPTTRRVIIFVPPLLLGGFYLLRRYV